MHTVLSKSSPPSLITFLPSLEIYLFDILGRPMSSLTLPLHSEEMQYFTVNPPLFFSEVMS